jgi:hypothetical protein
LSKLAQQQNNQAVKVEKTIRGMLEKEHSKRQCIRIVNYIGSDQGRFDSLVACFLNGPYRITQRAAWPLSISAERNPALVAIHLPHLIRFLSRNDIHDAAKRNILRLLQTVEIPARYHGKMLDVCFRFLSDKTEPVAVHVFAMTVLSRITQRFPELRKELRIILEDQLPYGSAGYRSRAMKVLKEIG